MSGHSPFYIVSQMLGNGPILASCKYHRGELVYRPAAASVNSYYFAANYTVCRSSSLGCSGMQFV